jgi:DNA polymerase epsilon subunit 3
MPRKDAYTGPISAQAQQDLVSEGIENFELPKSVVMRIAKSSVCFFWNMRKATIK